MCRAAEPGDSHLFEEWDNQKWQSPRTLAELGELVVDGLQGLLEHASMGWGGGPVQVSSGPEAGELQCAPPVESLALGGAQRGPNDASPCRLLLLRFNRLRFPPTSHTSLNHEVGRVR